MKKIGIKERMKLKKQKEKEKKGSNQTKLLDLENSHQFFKYSGDWKFIESKDNSKLWKFREKDLKNLVYDEKALNNDRALEKFKSIERLIKIGYNRYEIFDWETLIHRKRSRYKQGIIFKPTKSANFV